MASTISAATLTVTITEAVTLNGYDQGSKNELSIASVNEVMKRIVTCPASNQTVVFTSNATVHGAANAVDVNDVKYIRVTNLDDTNALELGMIGATTNYQVTLKAGESHILGSPDDLLLAEADTDPSFGTKEDLVTIEVDPAGNAIDIEIFVASG